MASTIPHGEPLLPSLPLIKLIRTGGSALALPRLRPFLSVNCEVTSTTSHGELLLVGTITESPRD